MPGIAEPVDDPEIEIFQMMPALARNVVDIRLIGGVTDTITERRNVAMLQKEGRNHYSAPLPFDGLALAAFDRMLVEDRRIGAARRRHKAIGKPVHDIFRGRLAQMDRNASALMQHDGTEIVDAVGLVGMLMGEEYRVDMIDLGVDQLLAQVGRGVDQDTRDSAIP